MTYTSRPPEKLSELIRVAIADARTIDRRTYEPNSAIWHTPDKLTCKVCLAGCVIAGTLRAPRQAVTIQRIKPDADSSVLVVDDEEWREALFSLEHARVGYWDHALCSRGVFIDAETDTALNNIPAPEPGTFKSWNDFDSFLASLEDRTARLRAVGL